MKKGVYTVEAYKESLEYCGVTIEQVVEFIATRTKANGYEYILHDRTPNKKPHYHLDFGWERTCPDLSVFLDACDACNKKFRKRALTPSPDKPCDYIQPLSFVDPKNGQLCREKHVIKGVKGRHKYLLHISDSAKKAGKEEYKRGELFQSADWCEDNYRLSPNTIRKQKLTEKYEQDEAEHGDPFVYVFMLIQELNICNLPQLINFIISSDEHKWCLPYVKNDLLKYNAIIRDFSALHRKEYAEASMRAAKSNNTDCCRNIEIKQELQAEPETYEVDDNPFDKPEEPEPIDFTTLEESEEPLLVDFDFVNTIDGMI